MIIEKYKNNTHLFQDIDECIISSYRVNDEEEAKKHVSSRFQYEGCYFSTSNGAWEERKWYVSFLRPGAREHIEWCRSLVGAENYHILTAAPQDYALSINRLLKLEFDINRVYSHEDFCMNVPLFKNANNILIDNETHSYHTEREHNKVNFLHGLPLEKLVKVEPFVVCWENCDKTPEYVESWKSKIIETINYE